MRCGSPVACAGSPPLIDRFEHSAACTPRAVSWAEELEHVREVMGLPASEAGETAGAQQAGQRQVTSFLLLTLVASFLQRVLAPA